MLSIQVEHNIIYTIAEDKLTDEDYDRLIPLLQEKIDRFGSIRWYFEMKEFEGWSLSDMWRELKFYFMKIENL